MKYFAKYDFSMVWFRSIEFELVAGALHGRESFGTEVTHFFEKFTQKLRFYFWGTCPHFWKEHTKKSVRHPKVTNRLFSKTLPRTQTICKVGYFSLIRFSSVSRACSDW